MRAKGYIIGFIMTVCICIGMFGFIDVKAEPTQAELDSAIEGMGGLDSTAYNLYDYMTSPPESAIEFLFLDKKSDGSDANFVGSKMITDGTGAVGAIFTTMKIVAVYLLIIYLLLEIDKLMLASGGEFNIKGFFFLLMKFGIGCYICSNMEDIVKWGFELNDSLLIEVALTPNELTPAQIQARLNLIETLDEMNIFEVMGSIITLLLGVIGAAIGNLLISFQCVSRKIEMIGRGCFLPLAVADTYKGMDSNGWRYLKKYAACALCGVGFYAVISIGQELVASQVMEFDGGLKSVFTAIVVPLSLGGAASAMKQVINDALGC